MNFAVKRKKKTVNPLECNANAKYFADICFRHYRNDRNDLFARGDRDDPIPNALSRVLRPAMLGVFAQKPQMYTVGMVRRVMLMQFP